MSETIQAILGFITIIAIIVLLLRNITVPALAFIGVSTITAVLLVLTGTYTLSEMGGLHQGGRRGRPRNGGSFHLLRPVLRHYDRCGAL